MLGLYFDYHQTKLGHISKDIKEVISKNNQEDGFSFSEETINRLAITAELARKIEKLIGCVGYLLEGDYCEKDFAKEWSKVIIE